jgi:hypothetical protein
VHAPRAASDKFRAFLSSSAAPKLATQRLGLLLAAVASLSGPRAAQDFAGQCVGMVGAAGSGDPAQLVSSCIPGRPRQDHTAAAAVRQRQLCGSNRCAAATGRMRFQQHGVDHTRPSLCLTPHALSSKQVAECGLSMMSALAEEVANMDGQRRKDLIAATEPQWPQVVAAAQLLAARGAAAGALRGTAGSAEHIHGDLMCAGERAGVNKSGR